MRDPAPDPRKTDIMAGDRRLSRPDASLPDWEVPDSAYRPVPIVWFTGAMLLQFLLLCLLFFALAGANGIYTMGFGGLLTGVVGAWTWRRGMASAPVGWRTATIMMLAVQLGLLLLAVSPRL